MTRIWRIIKEVEKKIVKEESWKLPEHDRKKYIWYKLPYVYNKKSSHNFAFSLDYFIEKGVRRFKKLYNMRIEYDSNVVGKVGTKNHALSIRVKVYFK